MLAETTTTSHAVGLTTQIHTDEAAVASLTEEWHALAVSAGLPYAGPQWMLAFWRHRHAATGRLLVVEVRSAETLMGVAPFYIERTGLGPAQLWLLGSGIGQRSAPVAAPGHEVAVAEAVGRGLRPHVGNIAAVQLPAMPAGTAWADAITRTWPTALRPECTRTEPGLCVDLADDHEQWLTARSSNFRKKRAKRRRALEEAGLTIRMSSAETLESDLLAMFALHHRRFGDTARTSSITPDVEVAVTDAARALLARNAAVHLVLERGGEVVAGDLYLIAGHRMCGWNGGFASSIAEFSPGTALLDEAIRVGHERGLRTLDLGAGDQLFKQRVADRTEDLSWVRLTRPGPVAALVRVEDVSRRLRIRGRTALARSGRVPARTDDKRVAST